jgi:hypothetical protein
VSHSSFCRPVLKSIVLLLLLSIPALAQNRGTITGRVTDESGAIIPGVSITILNINTGSRREAVTNETGTYTIELLPVGDYRIEAELPGFKRAVRSGITLNVDQTARIEFALSVGDVSENVEVSAEAPLVQTDDSALGVTMADRKIVDLPLNGRDFSALTYMIPGAFAPVQGSSLGYRGGFTVGGSTESTNQFILEGITNNGTGTMEIAGRIDIDALQEFKIQTSNYAAQYGKFAGAQVNAVIKSGTNDPHGTAYFFHRNDNLGARNFFDPWPLAHLPEFRRHQYGGSLGGPIIKNRTFYFASFQGQRQARYRTGTASVPLPQFFDGDFSAVSTPIMDPLSSQPFANNQIPRDRIWSGARILAPLWPLPQRVVGASGIATSSLPEPNNFSHFTAKLDHQLSQKHSISGSHTYYKSKLLEYEILGNPQIPGFASDSSINAQSSAIALVSTFTPSIVNEFRVGQSYVRRGRFQEIQGRDFNAALGISGTSADTLEIVRGVPRFNVTGFHFIGDATNIPQPRGDQTITFIDTFSFQKGAHSFKAGIDVYHQIMNLVFPSNGRGSFSFTGLLTGNAFADFVLGLPFQTSVAVIAAKADSHPRLTSFNGFFQDDWKVTPNLTLNLGIRYELNEPVVEKFNQLVTFDRTTLKQNIATADNRTIYNGDHNNFAPRFGFAWRPFSSSKFAVRGGYGVYYQLKNAEFNSFYLLNPPFFQTKLFQAIPQLSVISMTDPFPARLANVSGNPAGIDPNFRTSYYEQWTLGFQREFPANFVLDVSYEAKAGVHLQRTWNINQAVPPVAVAALRDSRRPFQGFGTINWTDTGGSSIYHAGQMRVEKRFSHGLSLIAGYTYGKMLAVGEATFQNVYNQKADRGPSTYDNRHRFQLSSLYELPFGDSRYFLSDAPGFVDKLIGGWEVAGIFLARSGQFFTPQWNGDLGNVGNASVRPNIVGDWRVKNPTPDRWWNPAAFAAPAAGTFGNAGVGILEGPGYSNIDFSIIKNTRFAESRKNLQLRFEFFNALNHPHFDVPDNVVNGASFGRVFTANQGQAGRDVQVGIKYIF